MAFSAAPPAAALAVEPDQEQQGSLAPDHLAGADRSGSPAFDPGGKPTDLPFVDRTAPQPLPGAGGDETRALDTEPAEDTGAAIVDAGDEAIGPTVERQDSAPAQPVPSPPPSPEQPSLPSEPSLELESPYAPAQLPGAAKRTRTHKPQRSASESPEETTPLDTVRPTPATTVKSEQAPLAARTFVARGDRAKPGDRSHVVQARESLWSVAGDALGGEPSAARIAREVNRLWQLNKERIGTGDPDLLMVGTKLRL